MSQDGINQFTSTGRPIVEVAVGVLVRPDGSVLLGQRPEGKPYEGYWEFPGGKIEQGETLFLGLRRELLEELGIEIRSAEEFMVIEHDYPHAYVRLHVCLVKEWTGSPKGLENQSLAWLESVQLSDVKSFSLQPILPATLPILEKLQEII
jgi:8-oxo-dGTP diphosphatase